LRARSAAVYTRNASQSRRLGILRMAIILVAVLIVAGYISPVKSYIERSRQIDSEKAAASELKDKHDRLVNEKAQLQDNVYVEQVARRDLGLVKPGEQPFVLKDLNRSQNGSANAAAGGQESAPVGVGVGEPSTDEAARQEQVNSASFLETFYSLLN
jgi:cell division protein FtsB